MWLFLFWKMHRQIWIPFTQEYVLSCLVELDPAVLEKNQKLFWKKLNYLNPRMFWRRSSNIFSLCSYYLYLTKDMALHLNKLNRLHLRILYVKYSGTWLGDSEEVNMWNYACTRMYGPLDRQIDNKDNCSEWLKSLCRRNSYNSWC